jgi:hypothetical protein
MTRVLFLAMVFWSAFWIWPALVGGSFTVFCIACLSYVLLRDRRRAKARAASRGIPAQMTLDAIREDYNMGGRAR